MYLNGKGGSLRLLSLAAFLGLSILPAHAAVIYQVTVNTSSIAPGTLGSIDLQFNPGGLTSQAATAAVTSFQPLAGLGSVLISTGPVSGSLSTNNLVFSNSANTYYSHEFTFGPSFIFRVSFDGPAITAPNNGLAGTSFGISLYDSAVNPLITADGLVGQVDINPNGTITTTGYPIGNAVATFQLVNDVPEPGTLPSMLLAGCAMSFLIRKRNARP